MMDKDIKKRKIAYHTYGIFNSGGMERVLINKANYLVEHGYDVTIIVTESGKDTFYPLSNRVKIIDLNIGYHALSGKSPIYSAFQMLKKQMKHKRMLKELLNNNSFDIFITLQHRFFIPQFQDGSKKIFEFHFSKANVKYEFERKSIAYRFLYSSLNWYQQRSIKLYDRFVTLTKEDLALQGFPKNGIAIENALSFTTDQSADLASKKIISIGRLSYQKGYDYLLKAWQKVCERDTSYTLHIYGAEQTEGEMLRQYVLDYKLINIFFYSPVKNIQEKLLESSIYVMSSRCEGFGMVLLEAMECGLPCISYACQCGPSEIINDGEDGILVQKVGDVDGLATALLKLMKDDDLRLSMGKEAKKNISRYSEQMIMDKWERLFNELLK